MKDAKSFPISLACLVLLIGPVAAAEQEPQTGVAPDDRALIEKSVESYVVAFNARDAKALAEHWSPAGVYISRSNGSQVTGRAAIEAEFASLFAEVVDMQLEVVSESIEFVSPNVAIEHGQATVLRPEAVPVASTYRAVYIKHDGNWLLDRVSEDEEVAPPSHYEHLQDLQWMIGTWLDESAEHQIETTCQWSRNNNFIVRSFKIEVDDRIDLSGIQLIGWDPAESKIRSWAFDSDGGFAEGSWTQKNGSWLVESNATLPDGQKGSSVNIMQVVDESTFGWKSTGREVGGTILPNVDEILIKRVGIRE